MTQISPAEAIRRYDVSKPTLYEDMKEGRLSFTINKKKKRRIDVAELERVYEPRTIDDEKPDVKNGKGNTKSNVNDEMVSREFMEQMLKDQRETYQGQIEILKEALDKAQDITLLLENKTEQGGENEDKTEKLISDLKEVTERSDKKFEAIMGRFAAEDKRREEFKKKRAEKLKQKKIDEELRKNRNPIARMKNMFSQNNKSSTTRQLQEVS